MGISWTEIILLAWNCYLTLALLKQSKFNKIVLEALEEIGRKE